MKLTKNKQYPDAFGGSLTEREDAAFSILGVPFDEKSTYRTGAAGGPDAIRAASTARSIHATTESGIDLETDTTIRDLGNYLSGGDTEKYFAGISDIVEKTAAAGSIPVTLGGDHSIAYPVVRGLLRRYEKLNIVWLDAHPDIYEEYGGDRLSHACPLSRILETGQAGKVFIGGIRSVPKKLRKRIGEYGIKVFHVSDIPTMKHLEVIGKTYLSIDIDILDPAFAPGVGTPVPGGLPTRDLIDLIKTFNLDIAGFDLVEMNPEYDHAEITAAAGAKIVMETIGRIAKLSKSAFTYSSEDY